MTLNAHANLFQMVGRLAAFHTDLVRSRMHDIITVNTRERDFHFDYEMLIIDFTTTTTEFIMHIGRQETPTTTMAAGYTFSFLFETL